MNDRVTMATEHPGLVVGTSGLLAAFNDLGVLNPLDVQSAQTIARMLGEDNELVLLAAALAVRGTRYGHVCIRLDSIREAVVVDGQDPEEVEDLPWPDPAEWQAAVEASPLVGADDAPLVLEEGRLYLQRYHHHESQVATLLLQRCGRRPEREGLAVPDRSGDRTALPLREGGSRPDLREGLGREGGKVPPPQAKADGTEPQNAGGTSALPSRKGDHAHGPDREGSEVPDGSDDQTALPWREGGARPDQREGLDREGDPPSMGREDGAYAAAGKTTLPLWEGRGSVSDRGEGEHQNRLDREGEVSPQTRELLANLLDPDTRQHDAALLALTSPLAVIAGGPGTGKTHTIAAMLASLAAEPAPFPRVALCAPTGKAAARLGEALTSIATDINSPTVTESLATVEPSTIHRLLGWTWDRSRFAHHEKNRLPHDLVIVDEMSMVSLPMAAKLLSAVRDEATVVLVGDPFQLESIEAGTVLADIVGAVETEGSPIRNHVVVLDRVHRFEEDSAIADFAEAVRSGDADAAMTLLETDSGHIRWAQDRKAAEFDELWHRIVEQRVRMVELAGEGRGNDALEELQSLAVLCARRTGRDGVSGWGREIERALDERFTGLRWGGDWYAGRPVMITSNDYNLELYNGDIGVCAETSDGLRVLFDSGREFPPSHLGEHATVHAMTIHKSQGSQFDKVVVVLPNESSRLLTRELLYTAVTRAQRCVDIVGGDDVVRAAVGRSVQRASGLGVRLAGSSVRDDPVNRLS